MKSVRKLRPHKPVETKRNWRHNRVSFRSAPQYLEYESSMNHTAPSRPSILGHQLRKFHYRGSNPGHSGESQVFRADPSSQLGWYCKSEVKPKLTVLTFVGRRALNAMAATPFAQAFCNKATPALRLKASMRLHISTRDCTFQAEGCTNQVRSGRLPFSAPHLSTQILARRPCMTQNFYQQHCHFDRK